MQPPDSPVRELPVESVMPVPVAPPEVVPEVVPEPAVDDFPELIAAAQQGHPVALRTLYERFAKIVAGYLRARGVRDVEDITSEVFVGAFSRLGSFSGDAQDFRAWLLTIAHHRWVDDRRRESRRVPTTQYEPGEDARVSDSAESECFNRFSLDEVHARLAALAPDQRDVLMLRVVGDLTIEQIALLMGKRVGAVKALQRRGLAALRRAIEAEGVPR